ncbi:MAG TPA: ROK family protein [Urbifossiella sp.]|nr:ROK family protein [Urbifossiella sp.]
MSERPGLLCGGIEVGGTKTVVAIGTGPDDVRAESRFPTKGFAKCWPAAIAFLREQERIHGRIAGVGVGGLGQIDTDPASPTYGRVTATLKDGWADVDCVTPLREAFGVPVGFDTDVVAAATAERRWGAGRGLRSLIYLTVGTAIGAAVVSGGRFVRGFSHPLVGHLPMPRDPAADPFPGCCPQHGDCWKGLAAGPAIGRRWGLPAEELPPDHPAWSLEAHYLAVGVVQLLYAFTPERFILGGGVMQQAQLFPLIRARVLERLGGYVRQPLVLERIDEYVVPPTLGPRAGVLGAIALGQEAVTSNPVQSQL